MTTATAAKEDPERIVDPIRSTHPSHMPRATLRLLGGFELATAEGAVEIPESAQRLVAFLALRRRPQTRLCIAGNLWPEKSDSRATANLRSTLWRAKLDDGTCVLQARGAMVGVVPGVYLDVWDIESIKPDTIARRFIEDGSGDYDRLFDELLPGWYDDWVVLERERLAQLQLRIAERLARIFVENDDHISATDIAYRTLAIDPIGLVKDRITGWLQ